LGKYRLIITEKPDAANRIANALDNNGKAKKMFERGVPYYQAFRNGEIIIVPALGHLYTVAGKEKAKRDYPILEYQWIPRYLAERRASKIRVWLKVITDLARDAEDFVDACDFDIEGIIIGYCILKYACGGKEEKAKRMKYSTLTQEDLQESYGHLLPHLDFSLVEAGLARHEVDWLYGINLSRALTTAAKNSTGQYVTISTGRVQGPTLKFLEEREKTIKCFVPTPYWTIKSNIRINGSSYEADYEKILENRQEAKKIVDDCKVKEGEIETVTIKEFKQFPPLPFDLGALQSEAYKVFHYTPLRSSNIAQHLYLIALISYPRTSSQKLPPAIGYKTILRKLSKDPAFAQQTIELLSKPTLKPNEGLKIDSAHPAIYPTGKLPEMLLKVEEKNIFDLIIHRFMAVFGEPAIRQSIKAVIRINGNHFEIAGIRTLREGWIRFYKPYGQIKDVILPQLTEHQKIDVKKVSSKENYTKPPERYNPQTLLLKMEKEEIGTKATRASTIQTLYDRKYLCGADKLVVSGLGLEVMDILSKYCPTVVSPELTKELEGKMEQIQSEQETREEVLKETVEILKPVASELKEKELVIGKQLSQALKQAWLDEKTLGSCPKCVDGTLVILHSKKTGKRFVGCSNYFEKKCCAVFPLPQFGTIKPLAGVCENCGCPIVYILMKGKRPWKLCLNPGCPSKGGQKNEM
jgi:DNA topoisomerase I